MLFIKGKSTKFEWYTQPAMEICASLECCLSRAKVQNLNDIHNRAAHDDPPLPVVYQGQKYKIWMIYTTCKTILWQATGLFIKGKSTKFEWYTQRVRSWSPRRCGCLSRAKVQNLNDIHNTQSNNAAWSRVVYQGQKYKIWMIYTTQEFEYYGFGFVVYQGQKYKIWMIYTTFQRCVPNHPLLFIKGKSTKFEWYTQQWFGYPRASLRCLSRAKVQNLNDMDEYSCINI